MTDTRGRSFSLDCAKALVALLIASVFATSAAAQEMGLGEPFPLVALPHLDDGRPGSVADYRGEKLVLHVFASW